jgi:hypothetical protein
MVKAAPPVWEVCFIPAKYRREPNSCVRRVFCCYNDLLDAMSTAFRLRAEEENVALEQKIFGGMK